MRYSPFQPARTRYNLIYCIFVRTLTKEFLCSQLTRLTLHKEGTRYYIAYQEDFFHPDVSNFIWCCDGAPHVISSHVARSFVQDFFAMIVPPLFKPVNLFLRIGGFACGLSARIAQAVVGAWRPRRGD
jgi:hypothetical protein